MGMFARSVLGTIVAGLTLFATEHVRCSYSKETSGVVYLSFLANFIFLIKQKLQVIISSPEPKAHR